MALLTAEKEGGGVAPLRVNENGELLTTSSGGGGDSPLTPLITTDTAHLADDPALRITLKQGDPIEVAVIGQIQPGQTAAGIAASTPSETVDSVVKVVGLDEVRTLLNTIQADTANLDAPTSTLLAELQTLVADVPASAREVTLQAVATSLSTLLSRLPAALISGALAVAVQGTVSLAPGTTVGIAGTLPLPSDAAKDSTLSTRASEATVAATLAAVDTLEAGQAAGNASLAAIAAATPALVGGKTPVDASGSSVSITGAVPVTDNGGSITTDTPQLPGALVGGRLDVNVGAAVLPPNAAAETTQAQVRDAVDQLEGYLDQVEDKLGTQAAQEATLGTRASETTAAAIRDAVDGLEGNTDQVESKLDTIAGRLPSALGKQAAGSSLSITLATGETVTITGAVSISGTPTVDTELPAAAALANNTPNPTVPAVGSFPHVWDATTSLWQRAAGSTSGAQMVAFDRAHLGPFGHLIAQPLTYISQITFTYGINSQIGGATVSGTGATVDSNAGLLRVQSGTGSTASAAYLSSRPLLYRAGQGMGMIWSQAFTTGLVNNTTIAGPSTDASNADGYFFGYKGTSFGIHHYRGGSEVSFTAQASWNGSVPSGFDPTKLNVYEIRYPYLGSGDIFFFVQEPTTGRSTLVHTIRYTNSSTALQVSNPTMRFLVRSVNSGNTTNITTLVGSVGMYVVGTRHFNGPTFAVNNQKAVSGGVETNVLSIRCATTLNGVTNRGAARLRLSTFVGDNGNTITGFFVRAGATVGGTPAFSPYGGSTADNGVTLTAASSMLSIDTAGTTAAGGTVIYNGGCARNNEIVLPVQEYDFVILPGETYTFSASPGANSNCAVFVSGVEEW